MSIPDFSHLFLTEQIVSTQGLNQRYLTHHQAGELVLISGKLLACDPLTLWNPEAFTGSFLPGRYPVILSVAHIHNKNGRNDKRVAYAMLQLSEEPAVRWEIAAISSQNLNSLEEAQIFGYGVDSGTGCFMDASVAEIIDELEENWNTQLLKELRKNYSPTWDWANLSVGELNQANVIAFSSGWGDGVYATYFGYNASHKIVNVITDFEVV
ncbi:MAG: DUF4241 domain-containing protein [Nostoc sp. NOS(2021)]|uniref:DUF4241 domain-containing protein n=1 Tax=Nostoc sp. NOS(2021) TaxID=2815407 RepID=UPI0025E99E79|nr:DUF4241 domain-containing protein [Nostoc sp. NOS(2021)]MBN3899128.1 DUF4241 domain-containing protein [Nostoc sp. NOS(2021)]